MSSSSNGLLILALFLIGNIFSKSKTSKEIESQVFPPDNKYYFGHLYTLPESSSGEGRFGLMVECLNPKEMHPHGAALIRRDSLNVNQIRHLVGKRVGFKIDGDDIVTHIVDFASVGEIDTFTNWPISLNGHDEELEGKHKTGVIRPLSMADQWSNSFRNHGLIESNSQIQYPVKKVNIDDDVYWMPALGTGDSIYYLMTDNLIRPYRQQGSEVSATNSDAHPLVYSISSLHWHDLSLIDHLLLNSLLIQHN